MPLADWFSSPDDALRVARAVAEIIVADPGYICLDEYEDGLSVEGAWRHDAVERLTRYFSSEAVKPNHPRRLAGMFADDGRILGGAVVYFGDAGFERYMKIEDVAISPEARGEGLGRALMDFLTDEARKAGCARLLLEAGAHNPRAQAWFEALGFRPLSTVMTCSLKSE